jgi:acetyl esterase/lipase
MMVLMVDPAARVGGVVGSRRRSALDVFHPELRRAARVLPRGGARSGLLPLLRRLVALMPDRAKDVVIEPVTTTSSVRMFRPASGASAGGALLWIHGGGLVLGTPMQDDDLCRKIANNLGIVVAAVKYRLAPEHRYPAALDDCYDALVWLSKQDGVDPARVAVGGASAGGGLAAAVALAAKERGEIALAFQLLVYPMLDDRTGARAELDGVPTRLWDNKANRFGWSSYLGQPAGGAGVSGLAAPGRAEELTGVAPAWIGVGTTDLFHDEDVQYAGRLQEAGVGCELVVVDGAFHAFERMAPKTTVARSFTAAAIAALGGALSG